MFRYRSHDVSTTATVKYEENASRLISVNSFYFYLISFFFRGHCNVHAYYSKTIRVNTKQIKRVHIRACIFCGHFCTPPTITRPQRAAMANDGKAFERNFVSMKSINPCVTVAYAYDQSTQFLLIVRAKTMR